MLSSEQIQYLMLLIREKHGPGYSRRVIGNVEIGTLQASLSIMLEIAIKKEKIV